MSVDVTEFGFMFVAGASALLSPCGFPMFPGYISYYMGTKISTHMAALGGATCTAGILTVFGLIGVAASLLGSVIHSYVVWLELVAGIVTLFMGIVLLAQVGLPVFLGRLKAPKHKGFVGLFFYGIVYGLATLGCSAPIFFAVLFWAISGGLLNGVANFLVYSAGMGVPMIITTILVAQAKKRLVNKLTNATPILQKVSGIVLVVVGAYLIYYYLSILL